MQHAATHHPIGLRQAVTAHGPWMFGLLVFEPHRLPFCRGPRWFASSHLQKLTPPAGLAESTHARPPPTTSGPRHVGPFDVRFASCNFTVHPCIAVSLSITSD